MMCLEARLLLVVKGAKEYFFMSTILALVKSKLWPTQGNMYKQEVIDRVIIFAQTLLARHANCAHLGPLGMGCFQANQVSYCAVLLLLLLLFLLVLCYAYDLVSWLSANSSHSVYGTDTRTTHNAVPCTHL